MPDSVRKAARVLDLFSVERPDRGPTEVAEELAIASKRPPGGVAAPGPTIADDLTPLGTVLLADRSGEAVDTTAVQRLRRRGYHLGPQRALEGVACAVAPLRLSDGAAPQAIGLCAPADRFERRGDHYGWAVAATSGHIARALRS